MQKFLCHPEKAFDGYFWNYYAHNPPTWNFSPDQLFQVLYGLWGHNLVLGDMKIAQDLDAQCLILAEKTQERALLMEGRRMTDETAFHRGELSVARKYLEQTLSLYDPQLHHAHSTTYGQDPGVASFSHGSWIYWHLGYPDQALKMAQKAVALGQDVSHPFSLGFARCYGAVAHQFCQDVQRVDELVETAITLSTEQGFVLWLAIATVLRGWVLTKQGKADEGIVQMRQGLADYKAISVNLSRPYLLALLAGVYGDMERTSEGLILLDEAMSLVEKGDLRHYEAELFRLKGELLLKYPAIFQGTNLYGFWFISMIKFRTMVETPVYYFLKHHVVGLLGR